MFFGLWLITTVIEEYVTLSDYISLLFGYLCRVISVVIFIINFVFLDTETKLT